MNEKSDIPCACLILPMPRPWYRSPFRWLKKRKLVKAYQKAVAEWDGTLIVITSPLVKPNSCYLVKDLPPLEGPFSPPPGTDLPKTDLRANLTPSSPRSCQDTITNDTVCEECGNDTVAEGQSMRLECLEDTLKHN